MFVRMKAGAHAGEVREVKYATGESLVREKRAERIAFDPAAPSPPPPAEIAVTPDVTRVVTPEPIAAAAKPAPSTKQKKKGKR